MLLFLVATTATVIGAAALAVVAEQRSALRRALAFLVIVPANITAVVLVTGFAGVFRPAWVTGCAVSIALVELAVRHLFAPPPRPLIGRQVRRGLRAAPRHPVVSGLAAVVGADLAWQVAGAVRLPMTSYDGLYYHLVGPTTWVQSGRIVESHLSVYSDGYPQGQEVIHAWSMVLLHTTRGTGLVVAWFAVMGAVAVGCLTRRFASRSGAVLAAVVFLSMPTVSLQIGTAYVDVAAAATVLAALTFLVAWSDRIETDLPYRGDAASSFLLAAVSVGLAVGIKASNVALIPAAVVFAGARLWTESDRPGPEFIRSRAERLVLLTSAGATLLGGVWYVRNWSLHGNPLWPVTALGFPGLGSFKDLVALDQAPQELAGHNPIFQIGRSWIEDLRLPAYVYDQRLGGLGAVWLVACVPALVWFAVRYVRRDRAVAVFVVGTTLLVWFASQMAWWSRFTLAFAGVGCVALGTAVDALGGWSREGGGYRRWLSTATRLLVAACVIASVQSAVRQPYEGLTTPGGGTASLRTRASAIRDGNGEQIFWPVGLFTGLDQLPAGSRIGIIDAKAGFLPQLLQGEDLERRLVPLDPPKRPSEVAKVMKRAHVSLLYLPDDLPADSVERQAILTEPRLRRFPLRTPIPFGAVYQLGGFRRCGPVSVSIFVARTKTADVIGGSIADSCGRSTGAPVELWMSGPRRDAPYDGAARLSDDHRVDAAGNYSITLSRTALSSERRYFIRTPGYVEPTLVHEAGASPFFDAPR